MKKKIVSSILILSSLLAVTSCSALTKNSDSNSASAESQSTNNESSKIEESSEASSSQVFSSSNIMTSSQAASSIYESSIEIASSIAEMSQAQSSVYAQSSIESSNIESSIAQPSNTASSAISSSQIYSSVASSSIAQASSSIAQSSSSYSSQAQASSTVASSATQSSIAQSSLAYSSQAASSNIAVSSAVASSSIAQSSSSYSSQAQASSTVASSQVQSSAIQSSSSIASSSVVSSQASSSQAQASSTYSSTTISSSNLPSSSQGTTEENGITLVEYAGYNEGAYVIFNTASSDTSSDYTVSYSTNGTSYVDIDEELVRVNNGVGRADILGLQSGRYYIKVSNNKGNYAITSKIDVSSQDRSGYAHFNNTGVGAYNDNGTLKSNAVIVYVSDETKNTVTATINGKKYTGLVNIVQNAKSVPVVVRILDDIKTCQFNKISYSSTPMTLELLDEQANSLGGNYSGYKASKIIENGWNSYSDDLANGITELNNLSSSMSYGGNSHNKNLYTNAFDTAWNMCNVSGASNLTIEGVGTDAGLFQWGFTFSSCNNIEIKNLRFHNYTEDAIGIEGGSYFWLHNNTFDIGVNNWDFSDEQDKGDGDGATDFKKANNLTISYCRYNNTHKSNLIGGSDSNQQWNITLHHNFYNNCSSRLPLGRQGNMHMYNNYYYNCSTCQDIRANAFVLSEYNYFDNCKNPQKVTVTSDYTGTVIKSYNDILNNCGDSYATVVYDREQSLNGNCNGGTFNNFDTNTEYFYYDTSNKCSKVAIMNNAIDLKTFVPAHAGAGMLNNLGLIEDVVEYTITFNTNGGSSIDPITVMSGYTIPSVTTTKANYILEGWYTDESLNTKFDVTTPIKHDLVLYAKWVEKITISFNTNGGSSIASIDIQKGGTVTIPSTSYSGHILEGWYLDSGFNTKYTSSTTFNSSSTLYANWIESNELYITFNDFEKGEITTSVTVGNATVVDNTTSKKTEIKTTSEVTLGNVAVTKYVSFGGAGKYEELSVQFEVSSKANITVYYAGSATRYVKLVDDDSFSETSTVGTEGTSTSNIVSYTFENVEAGNYAIASSGSSIYIFAILIEY